MSTNNHIKKSHLKAVERFNEELKAFAERTEENPVTLYEDAYTSFTLANVRVEGDSLCYTYDGKEESDIVVDIDDETGEEYEREWDGIMDTLKFWKACLRRAKRYWEMDTERLDRIQDGEEEDIEDE